MKQYRKAFTNPVFNTFFDKNVSTNKVQGNLIGNSKVWVIHINHAMGQGYVGFINKINRYGKDNTRPNLSDIKLFGRMLQAHLFDKSTADFYANQLAASGCYEVTIKRAG